MPSPGYADLDLDFSRLPFSQRIATPEESALLGCSIGTLAFRKELGSDPPSSLLLCQTEAGTPEGPIYFWNGARLFIGQYESGHRVGGWREPSGANDARILSLLQVPSNGDLVGQNDVSNAWMLAIGSTVLAILATAAFLAMLVRKTRAPKPPPGRPR